MIEFFRDQNKIAKWSFTLSFIGLLIFALLNMAITYYHSGNFGVLSGVVPDNNNVVIEWILFLIYPLVIDVPVLVTGTVLITVGFLGLSNELRNSIRWANVGFAVLSCVGNYISIYSSNDDWVYAFAGIISPFSLWLLSELLFSFVAEFVSKNEISKSINELTKTESKLKESVNGLAQTKNSMSTAQQEFEKFKQFTTNEKASIEEVIKLLETQKDKLEQHVKTLGGEVNILKKEKSNIQSWFSSMATSNSTNKDKKTNTTKRRAALLKEFAKQNGHNLTSLNQDVTFFESNANINGKF